jgi:hypothetical protein
MFGLSVPKLPPAIRAELNRADEKDANSLILEQAAYDPRPVSLRFALQLLVTCLGNLPRVIDLANRIYPPEPPIPLRHLLPLHPLLSILLQHFAGDSIVFGKVEVV